MFHTKPMLTRAEKAMVTRSRNLKERKLVSFFRKFYLVAIVSLITTNLVIGVYRSYSDLVGEMTSMGVAYAKTPVMQGKAEIHPEIPKDWVRSRLTLAGIDPFDADCIIRKESNWNPDIVIMDSNKKLSIGLWQINGAHDSKISNADKLDYKKATEYAISLYEKQGWKPWALSAKKCGL